MYILSFFYECIFQLISEMHLVNDSTAENLPFDVSRQPISIHIPLWRFLAGYSAFVI